MPRSEKIFVKIGVIFQFPRGLTEDVLDCVTAVSVLTFNSLED